MPHSVIRHRTLYSLIACAAWIGSAQAAHAGWEICNQTAVPLHITYRVPSDSCGNGYRQDHIVMSPGACHVAYNGSAIGKPLYYYAEDAAVTMVWEGSSWFWVPDVRTACAPDIVCRPSVGTRCGGGEWFPMIKKTSSTAHKRFNLIP